MRKIILVLSLIAISFSVSNCSKSSPSGPDSSKLYGTWNLDFFITNNTPVLTLTCSQNVTYTFSSNGTYSKILYAGSGNSNCQIASTINGTFENLGNDQYVLTPLGGGANENLNITFQDSYSKFTITYPNSDTYVYLKK